jgi:hypothetical protein
VLARSASCITEGEGGREGGQPPDLWWKHKVLHDPFIFKLYAMMVETKQRMLRVMIWKQERKKDTCLAYNVTRMLQHIQGLQEIYRFNKSRNLQNDTNHLN